MLAKAMIRTTQTSRQIIGLLEPGTRT